LLVEDNPASATITLAGLARLGYRADHVTTGEDALTTLKRRRYDVVLMDVHMPRLDGIETTRAIRRELMPKEQPYIIGLTASTGKSDRAACLAAGMDEYLTKPLDVVDLAFLLTNLSPEHSA
jgi:CheY-like chemotaxis protein